MLGYIRHYRDRIRARVFPGNGSVRMNAPRNLYALIDKRGSFTAADVFTSRRAAKDEQIKARTIYNERLSLRVYKLQPVKR